MSNVEICFGFLQRLRMRNNMRFMVQPFSFKGFATYYSSGCRPSVAPFLFQCPVWNWIGTIKVETGYFNNLPLDFNSIAPTKTHQISYFVFQSCKKIIDLDLKDRRSLSWSWSFVWSRSLLVIFANWSWSLIFDLQIWRSIFHHDFW